MDPQRAKAGIPQDFAEKEPEAGEIQRRNFQKAMRAGVKVARQFAWQVRYGQTPMGAIRSATVVAGEPIGRDDIGSLEPGKLADLIAVKGDSLAYVTVPEKVSFVTREGKVYKGRARALARGYRK